MTDRSPCLLLSTYGGDVGEVVPGLRSLRHDHFIFIASEDDDGQLASLLDRLKVRYSFLMLDPLDVMGSAMAVERVVEEFKAKGWRVSLDITGGCKLLSDAAVIAALGTGTEVCCFEAGARRFPGLSGLGVSEALPKDVSEALHRFRWPMPMEMVRGWGRGHPDGRILRRMKKMDLIRVNDLDGSVGLELTERGRACLEWLLRSERPITVSSV